MTLFPPGRARLTGVALALLFLGGGIALPTPATSQVRPDSTRALPDSLVILLPEDSLALLEAQADSINPEDTLPAVQIPELVEPIPAGWYSSVWKWDREEILASKAITLVELLEEVPGVVPLRGGDYGTPAGVSLFGGGGGRTKVFKDGIELLPVEGSVVDLNRVGLGGLRSIRVVRSAGGELQIHLETILAEGGQPYSLIEAGTGDLGSNVFRGTFSHPRALGGAITLAMERVDTRGPRGEEPGISQGAWLRYARALPGSGALILDYGARSTSREGTYSPGGASRTDWSVRSRWNPITGLTGDLSYAGSSISTEKPDTFPFGLEGRTQLGALISYDSPWVQALGRIRQLWGEGLPSTTADLEVHGLLGRFGGVAGELGWENWDGGSTNKTRLRAWTAPFAGISLFAETGSGGWGLPYLPGVPPPDPDPEAEPEEEPIPVDSIPGVLPGPRFGDQSGNRYGAEFRWRNLYLAGAFLKTEADSLFLLGLPTDRHGATLVGGSRNGFEVSARLPIYPSGFSLVGWWQQWDQGEKPWTTPADSAAEPELLPENEAPLRYLPRQSYQASLNFHDTFLPTENLELWFDLGVRGRDAMAVPFPEEVPIGDEGDVRLVPTTVPFYQNWFVRLQVRIVTVRVFISWENFMVRDQNQDFPGRFLPATRSMYGVRWTMWN